MNNYAELLRKWRTEYIALFFKFTTAATIGSKVMEEVEKKMQRSIHDRMVIAIRAWRDWQSQHYAPVVIPTSLEEGNNYCQTEQIEAADVVVVEELKCPLIDAVAIYDLFSVADLATVQLHKAKIIYTGVGHGNIEWMPQSGQLVYAYTDAPIEDQQTYYMELVRFEAPSIYGDQVVKIDFWIKVHCNDYTDDCDSDAPSLFISDAGYSQSPWANTYKGIIVGGVEPVSFYWSVDAPCNIDGSNTETNVVVTFDPMDFPFFDGTNYTTFLYLNVQDGRGCTYQYSRAITYYANECEADVLVIDQDTGPHTIVCGDNDSLHAYQTGWELVSGPDHGTLTIIDAATGTVEYTPDAGYVGDDIVYYNWAGNSVQGTCQIQITVNAVAVPCDEVIITVDSLTHSQEGVVGPGNPLGEPEVVCLSVTFTNVASLDDVLLRLTHLGVGIVLTPDLSTWDWDGNTLSGCTPVPKQGNYEIYIEGTNTCGTVHHTEYYEVRYNVAPIPADDDMFVLMDAVGCLDVTMNDYDENGETLTLISIDGNPFDAVNTPVVLAGGHQVEWVDGQQLCVTPATGFTGTFSFQYEVEDQGGSDGLVKSGTATVNVTVGSTCPGSVSIEVTEDTTYSPDQFTTVVTLSPASSGTVDYKFYYDWGGGYPSSPDVVNNTGTDVQSSDSALVNVKVEVYDHATGCIYTVESPVTIVI